ncbi:hypothetical protein BO94DRAFT_566852 [Aspergillus sclerotioniger CBS 115572]|uniref:MARVEL domain-containing protein n=1 Tax=Aspergillus sclerotioniger CBS 115572 TaxID=1450535 RepID=A0A317WBG3_9EURO|nr:hypothetical protein BO94DRAFT_566852 [Aspergillus sclerotioniger CBS 115572]PWY83683.1 hypothetical protein BO94DRAFT_566852 [Aspergillus sclerotioniger CBS 115572]
MPPNPTPVLTLSSLTISTLLLLTSFILTTYTLTTYLHQATHLTSLVAKVHIYNHPILITTSYHIFATIFTSAVFLTLAFTTRRSTSKSTSAPVSWVLKGSVVLGLIFLTASLIAFTVILATGEVGFGASVGPRVTVYLDESANELVYRDDGTGVAGVVLGWVGWGAGVVSCVMMFVGGRRNGTNEEGDMEKEVNVEEESEVGSDSGRRE